MKNRKDLDQLYREHLRNAEVKPPMDAWSNIAARLPEKKKKKAVLPLWYKIAGAAALLLLLVSLSYTYFSPSPVLTESPVISEEESLEQIPDQKKQTPSLQHQKTQSQEQLLESKSQIAGKESQDVSRPIKNRKTSLESFEKPIADPAEQNTRVLGQVAFENSEAANQAKPLATKGDSEIDSGSQRSNTQQARPESAEITRQEPGPDQSSDAESLIAFENTDDEVSGESFGRLSIGPKAAPVFFGSAGGNGIEGTSGTGSGEASISYGLQVAYKVSKNISIRSGLQIVNLNSSTRELPMNAAAMKEVSETGAAVMLTAPAAGEMELRKDVNFFEVPLEMEYALIDKKFKLNLIGGGSFLLLDKSSVSLNSSFGARDLKEAENSDPLSFSTNLGVGLGYELSRQFELHLEPMVKFPLTSESLMGPYYFGIYSGFRYRF